MFRITTLVNCFQIVVVLIVHRSSYLDHTLTMRLLQTYGVSAPHSQSFSGPFDSPLHPN